MSLPIATVLGALAAAQAAEVVPALQQMGQPGAPDINYAGGTAATTSLLLVLLAAQSAAGPDHAGDDTLAARAQAQWQIIAAPLGLPLPVPVD